MRNAVAIAVDGVMRHEVGHRPIPEGVALYQSLVPNWNVVLLAGWDDPGYAAELEHFLQTEQLHDHSKVVYTGDRLDQAMHLRNSGMSLAFIVEADPLQSALLFDQGFNVMHFMHAQYARPQWRPGYAATVAPWDSLVEHELATKAVKAADKRVDL